MLRAFRSYLCSRDLNIAFQMASVTEGLSAATAVFVSGAVHNDLVGTSWEARLEHVDLATTSRSGRTGRVLAGIELYRLRTR